MNSKDELKNDHMIIKKWYYYSPRNGKIVRKVIWMEYYLQLNLTLVPGLPQHASNVNTECVRKSKQLYSAVLQVLIDLNFIILILICFWLMIPGVNYAIYSCSSARATPWVLLYRSVTLSRMGGGQKDTPY